MRTLGQLKNFVEGRWLFIAALVCFCSFAAFGQQRLLVIGGGERPAEAMKQFVTWSGGERSTILVITWASGVPDESFESLKKQFTEAGAGSVLDAPRRPLDKKGRAEFVRMLEQASGVFFSGGDQNRIMDVLADEPLLTSLRAKYNSGTPFGGTSAGAAVMSDPMMTGDADLKLLDGKQVGVRKGLGLVPNVIFDQHFLVRQRHNRLFGLVMENPRMLGIGIDEDTAVLIEDNRRLQVVGKTQVMFVHSPNGRQPFRVSFLNSGERFDLRERRPAGRKAEFRREDKEMKKAYLAAAALLFAVSCGTPTADPFAGQWIDLTHDFDEKTVYWVTAEPFKRTTVAEGTTDKGFYYSAYNFSGAEHGGTHLDAPIHFAEGKKTADQIEIKELIGPGVKIDVAAKAEADRDYLISTDDIKAWETANGQIAEGSIILFSTGFAKRWPDLKTYLGTEQKGPDAVKDLHFPGLDPAAAKWLVENRKIKAVGIDTASIDRGQSTTFEAHVALMTNNIPAFENVGDMSGLPPKGFHVFAFPMKIKGGSGGPLRIAAFLSATTD